MPRASPGSGPWWNRLGVGAGEGASPSPHKPDPGTMHQSRGSPTHHIGRFSWEILDEMLY